MKATNNSTGATSMTIEELDFDRKVPVPVSLRKSYKDRLVSEAEKETKQGPDRVYLSTIVERALELYWEKQPA